MVLLTNSPQVALATEEANAAHVAKPPTMICHCSRKANQPINPLRLQTPIWLCHVNGQMGTVEKAPLWKAYDGKCDKSVRVWERDRHSRPSPTVWLSPRLAATRQQPTSHLLFSRLAQHEPPPHPTVPLSLTTPHPRWLASQLLSLTIEATLCGLSSWKQWSWSIDAQPRESSSWHCHSSAS